MVKKKFLQIPYGTKDILPGEARAKREIETGIINNFAAWGYDEVATPTFEYLEIFSDEGAGLLAESFKFFDRSNQTLILRSDMTKPIARMVATRLDDGRLNRISYLANIFRYEEAQAGRQCEFSQAGIELMGAAEPAADAEVLALAVSSLQVAGLQDFTVSLGHSDFIAGLLEEAGLNAAQAEDLKDIVLSHNMVGLETLLSTLDIKSDLQALFRRLLLLHGDLGMLRELKKTVGNDKSRMALENLEEIYALAEEYGVAGFISFDLGLIRNFDYYTGMVFEVYTPGMGFPICGGGRYDKMMEAFGKSCPATGFAAGIDRIMLVLARRDKLQTQTEWDYYVAWREGRLPQAIVRVMELRAAGKKTKLAVRPSDAEAAEKERERNFCRKLVFIE
ncbi:MAG: ATP phosphoribosyltransferase regulatory subunit [Acidaminococcaceae bacterium]|nr:ATP phosphoribosyltransferase regulatory subunit [Acidaminococcaceae bacterium]